MNSREFPANNQNDIETLIAGASNLDPDGPAILALKIDDRSASGRHFF